MEESSDVAIYPTPPIRVDSGLLEEGAARSSKGQMLNNGSSLGPAREPTTGKFTHTLDISDPPPPYSRDPDQERSGRAIALLNLIRPLTIYADFDEAEADDPLEAQLTQVEDAVGSTCHWLGKRQEYMRWLNGEGPPLLMVLALPGYGKSVLSKFAIRSLREAGQRVSGFFCSRATTVRSSVLNVLATFLYKLLDEDNSLGRFVTKSILREGVTVQNLWQLFVRLSKHQPLARSIFVIDGLDECSEESQDELRENLRALDSSFNFRILITSRPYSIPKALANAHASVQPSSEETSDDIKEYLDVEFQKEAEVFSEATADYIRKHAAEGSEGMFLLVAFRLKEYRQKRRQEGLKFASTPQAIEELFSNLPRVFGDFYGSEIDKILLNDDEDTTHKAATIVNILLAAQEPLNEQELTSALAFAHHEFKTWEESVSQTELHIFYAAEMLCGSLVKVIDAKISIAHPSAREYLTNQSVRDQLRSVEQTSRLQFLQMVDVLTGHALLTKASLRLLLLPDIELDQKHKESNTPLLRYSLTHWPVHLRRSESEICKFSALIGRFFTSLSKPLLRWTNLAGENNVDASSYPVPKTIFLIASLQLENVLTFVENPSSDGGEYMLFDQPLDIEAADRNSGLTPLYAAILRKNAGIVEKFLSLGALANTTTKAGSRPLTAAIALNCRTIVQLLLDHGANVDLEYSPEEINSAGKDSECPLYTAYIQGFRAKDMSIFHTLIGCGARTVEKLQTKESILMEAAYRGDLESTETIFRLELYKDVNERNIWGLSALHWAAIAGKPETIPYLIEKGANINSVDVEGSTSLAWAAQKGHEEVVKILLAYGADVNLAGSWTPLISAAMGNRLGCVELLLQQPQVDLNATSTLGKTSLMIAASNAYERIALLLLERGANIHVKNSNGATALYSACLGGSVEVVHKLLAKGADVSSTPQSGITPLHAAAYWGYTEIVHALVNHNAPLNVQTVDALWTPLLAALCQDNIEVANILLDAGAEASIPARKGSDAFLMACEAVSDEKLLQRIIDLPSDIYRRTYAGDSALHLAAINKASQAPLQYLLKIGIFDLSSRNEEGVTALWNAATRGSDSTVNLLLDYDHGVNVRSKTGWTVLHGAAYGCKQGSTIRRILEHANLRYLERGLPINPLCLAIRVQNEEGIEVLKEHDHLVTGRNDSGWMPLHEAAKENNRDLVQTLLKRGAVKDVVEQDNWSPFLCALTNSNEDLALDLFPNSTKVLNAVTGSLFRCTHAAARFSTRLTEKLAVMDEKALIRTDISNTSCLHYATQPDSAEIIEWVLLRCKKHLNLPNWFGSTPLILAARTGASEALEVLTQNGADTKLLDLWGLPAIYHARRHGQSRKVLVQADPHWSNEWLSRSSEDPDLRQNFIYRICSLLKTILTAVMKDDDDISSAIRRLCYTVAMEGFFFVGDDESAQIAFEALHGPPSSIILSKVWCNKCGKGVRSRTFICRTCISRWFCKDCIVSVRKSGWKGCIGHARFELPRESWFTRSAADFSGDDRDEKTWLSDTLARYEKLKTDFTEEPSEPCSRPLGFPKPSDKVFELCQGSTFEAFKDHLLEFPADVASEFEGTYGLPTFIIRRSATDDEAYSLLEVVSFAGCRMLRPSPPEHCPLNAAIMKGYERSTELLIDTIDRKLALENGTGSEMLKVLLRKKWFRSVKTALELHQPWIAQNEFAWIENLYQSNASHEEILQKLLQLNLDSPWADIERTRGIRTPRLDHHGTNCIHFGLREPDHAMTGLAFDDNRSVNSIDSGSSEETSFCDIIASYCGVAGVFPENKYNVSFKYEDGFVSIHYGGSTEEERATTYELLRDAGAGLLEAMALAQDHDQCCEGFFVPVLIPKFSSSVHLARIPYGLVIEFVNSLPATDATTREISSALESAASLAKSIFTAAFSASRPDSSLRDLLAGGNLHICSIAMQFLTLGFLNFCRGYLSKSPISLTKEQWTRFILLGIEEGSCIVVQPQRMNCLGDMLQDEIFVSSFIPQPAERGKVLLEENAALQNPGKPQNLFATSIAIHEVWGPADFICPKGHENDLVIGMQLLGGHISVSGPTSDGCLPVHWSKGPHHFPPKNVKAFKLDEDVILGTPELTVNTGHRCEVETAVQSMQASEVTLGADDDFEVYASRSDGLQLGQYAIVTRNWTKNRRVGRNLKQLAMDDIQTVHLKNLSHLNQPYGLIVSACTGVAKRLPLRQVVSMMMSSFVLKCFSGADHPASYQDFERDLENVLMGSDSIADFIRLQSHRDSALAVHAHKIIAGILSILKDTGINEAEDYFRIAWPRADAPRYGLEFRCSHAKDKWLRVLQDSKRAATFAIFTPECFETTWLTCRAAWKTPRVPLSMFLTQVQLDKKYCQERAMPAGWSLIPGSHYHIRKKSVTRFANFTGTVSEKGVFVVYEIWNVGLSSRPHGFIVPIAAPIVNKERFLYERHMNESLVQACWVMIGPETNAYL